MPATLKLRLRDKVMPLWDTSTSVCIYHSNRKHLQNDCFTWYSYGRMCILYTKRQQRRWFCLCLWAPDLFNASARKFKSAETGDIVSSRGPFPTCADYSTIRQQVVVSSAPARIFHQCYTCYRLLRHVSPLMPNPKPLTFPVTDTCYNWKGFFSYKAIQIIRTLCVCVCVCVCVCAYIYLQKWFRNRECKWSDLGCTPNFQRVWDLFLNLIFSTKKLWS